MPSIRLAVLVFDGRRVLVNEASGRNLPWMELPGGDVREDETILEERGPGMTGLPVSGYRFLESVYVRRGAGSIVNLYLAETVAGGLPETAPSGFAWATADELADSAIANEVLEMLETILADYPGGGGGDVASWRLGNGHGEGL